MNSDVKQSGNSSVGDFVGVLIEAAIVLAAVLALAWGYTHLQRPVDLFGGHDWDAVQYVTMAEQFRAGEPMSAQGPEYRRIFTAVLAGLWTQHSTVEAFYKIEVFSAIVGLMLLHLWARLQLRSYLLPAFFTLLAACTLWGPLRSSLFFVTGIEASSFLVLIIGYLLVDRFWQRQSKIWLAALCLLGLIGGAVRESCLLPLFAVVFTGNPVVWKEVLDLRLWRSVPRLLSMLFRRERLILFLPLLCALASTQIVSQVASLSDQWSYLYAVGLGFANVGPTRYAAAALHSYGPMLLLLCFAPLYSARFLSRQQPWLFVCLAFVFLSWAAYGDERYFIWFYPVIIIMLGGLLQSALDTRGRALFLLALLPCSLIAVRAFFAATLPSDPVVEKHVVLEALAHFLPDGYRHREMMAYSAYAKAVTAAVALNLIVGWLLWLLLQRLARNGGASAASGAQAGTGA